MRRPVTHWYTKDQPIFENTDDMDCRIDVARIPGGEINCEPCQLPHAITKMFFRVRYTTLLENLSQYVRNNGEGELGVPKIITSSHLPV